MPTSIGDVLRIACRQSVDGTDDNINVFHMGIATNPTPNTNAALLADVAERMSTAWAEIASSLCSALDAVDITVYNVTDDAPVGVTSWGAGYTGGTGSGECMPPADCLLALYPTGVKRTIGRAYLGPFTEATQNGGLWTGTVTAAVGAWYAELTAAAALTNGTVLQFGVYKRSTGLLYQPSSFRAQPRTAYQLRRKPGRGS